MHSVLLRFVLFLIEIYPIGCCRCVRTQAVKVVLRLNYHYLITLLYPESEISREKTVRNVPRNRLKVSFLSDVYRMKIIS